MGRAQKKSVPEPVIETAKAPEPTPIRAISLDLGNAYSNLVADGGIRADWRSIQGRISEAKRLKDLPFDDAISFMGNWHVFGEAAYTYAPRSLDDYPATNRYESDWYKRNFAYAMHRAYGLRLQNGPFEPMIALSLPARLFKNDLIVERVRGKLIGQYHIQNVQDQILSVSIRPENLNIIPEGVGSFLLAAQATEGESQYNHGLWLVIDVGYLTTDIVAFRDGDYMPDLADSDPAAGMNTVADLVSRHIAGATGVQLRGADVDPQLDCEAMPVNGTPITISEPKARGLDELGQRIGRFAVQVAAGQNVAGVLLTGGGAERVRGYLRAPGLPAGVVAPNPRKANAEGAFILIQE